MTGLLAGSEPSRTAAGTRQRRLPRAKTAAFGLLAILGVAVFAGLGAWQLHRRAWKLDLIVRVEQRAHAPAEAAPGPDAWPAITAERDEYRHIRVTGVFLPGAETLVQAITERGGGFWVMSPLRSAQGFVVLINRGFVPSDRSDPADRRAAEIAGETTVTGLLRMTEPNGAFLRSNDPAANRWFSRDVAAIAAKDRLPGAAPYFIDADATPNPGGLPVGGLTVLAFPNNHLVYAITWFGLALLVAGASANAARSAGKGSQ